MGGNAQIDANYRRNRRNFPAGFSKGPHGSGIAPEVRPDCCNLSTGPLFGRRGDAAAVLQQHTGELASRAAAMTERGGWPAPPKQRRRPCREGPSARGRDPRCGPRASGRTPSSPNSMSTCRRWTSPAEAPATCAAVRWRCGALPSAGSPATPRSASTTPTRRGRLVVAAYHRRDRQRRHAVPRRFGHPAINDGGRVVRLVIHPILTVARDADGRLCELAARHGGQRESWMQIAITREPTAPSSPA